MLYALTSLFYWVMLYSSLPQALQPLVTVVDLTPRCLVFLPACFLAFGGISPRKVFLYALFTLVNIACVLDVKFNLASKPIDSATIMKIGTYNVGGGDISAEDIVKWYLAHQLDALLLQEAKQEIFNELLPEPLVLNCHKGLCLLTQHQFESRMQLDRKPLGGYGNYAASYYIDIRGQRLPLVNVHLNTPRPALQTQTAPITNHRTFLRMHANRELESITASQLVQEEKKLSVVGGDFNLTEQSEIYRRHWKCWQNGFSKAGTGLGYSKLPRSLGVRIDHLLFGHGLVVHSSNVHPSMGGDHRPVIAYFSVDPKVNGARTTGLPIALPRSFFR